MLPTPWNHIEAAMAYGRGHPLLVIVERRLKSEGLLEQGYDWFVQRVDVSSAALTTLEFNGVLADWKARVEERHKKKIDSAAKEESPAEWTVVRLLGALRPGQLWSVAAALAVLLGGAFAIGAKLFR